MVSEINDGLICNFQRNEMKLRAEHLPIIIVRDVCHVLKIKYL